MFRFDDDRTYSMPPHFGPDPVVGRMDENAFVVHEDVTSVALAYTTDRQQLEQYLPTGFELTEPLLQVFAASNRGCQWLAGRSYNVLGVSVPTVFRGEVDEVRGPYVLVLWEDCTEAIIGGREQTGVPKIPAEVPTPRLTNGQWRATASAYGNRFINLELSDVQALSEKEVQAMNEQREITQMMGWRYIPNIGRPGAALSHATLYPQELGDTKKAWRGTPEVAWTALNSEQSPTQHHIIQALAALPVGEYRYGIAMNGPVTLRVGQARALR